MDWCRKLLRVAAEIRRLDRTVCVEWFSKRCKLRFEVQILRLIFPF